MADSIEFQTEVRASLSRIETMLGVLARLVSVPEPSGNTGDAILLSSFTTKEHQIIQMLVRDASNDEIADRLGVSVNTIKTRLIMICKKLGVQRRAAAISKLAPIIGRVPDGVYMEASGGLSKHWDEEQSLPSAAARN